MKIMLTDCDHETLDQENEVFLKENLKFDIFNCKTEDDLIKNGKGYSIFMNQYAPFTREVIKALTPDIKLIVRYGVGVNNVDLDAAREFGVEVCNIPDYGMNEVADHAVSIMMALTRKIVLMNDYTKNEKWDYVKSIPIYRLQEQTVGIFGFGRIGKTFAKRMQGFSMKILVCDISNNALTDLSEFPNVTVVDFDTLIKQSDIISIHAPFNNETNNIFNMDVFNKMKTSSYLINVSRGGIINEEDLFVALSEGIIAGAGIDVVKDEPLSVGAKLFSLDNFICTPHMAWYSVQAAIELKRKVALTACSFYKGEEVLYSVL